MWWENEAEKSIDLNGKGLLKVINKKIAVHIHLYYVDLIEEFINYVNNIPYKYDLYVSIVNNEVYEKVESILKEKLVNADLVRIKVVENRGRDFGPMIVAFGEELKVYDYVCHIHTKKSLYTGTEQSGWRQYLLDGVLGSPERVKQIITTFETMASVGMIYPETFKNMPYWAHTWLCNKYKGFSFLNKLGVKCDTTKTYIDYAVGSMFWVRVKSLEKLFDAKLTISDFPEEKGQNDGTLAHVIERALPLIVNDKGYKIGVIENNILNIGAGKKNLYQYWQMNKQVIKMAIDRADIISFDIFDTLIMRNILQPDNVFKAINGKVNSVLKRKVNFIELRKKAEESFRRKTNFSQDCNIDQIYDELQIIGSLTKDECELIKNIEIQEELKMCIPRKDVIEMFHYAKECNKTVVLISDMYLKNEHITDILKKCGITGYDEMLISNELNKRKDNSSMWEYYIERNKGKKLLHIGDNEHSDIQLACDKGIRTIHVLSSKDLLELSGLKAAWGIDYGNLSYQDAILLGISVSEFLNSPYALNKSKGEIRLDSPEQLGYSIFGPILTGFTLWLSSKLLANKEKRVYFLAREGYLLIRLFKILQEYVDDFKDLKVEYLLTSRRGAGVPTLTEDNLFDPLEQKYEGTIGNLLEARYGIVIQNEAMHERIEIPHERQKAENVVKAYKQDILNEASKEKEEYLKYLNNMGMEADESIAVVDIGYAGTIQYYLSELLDRSIAGYYLVKDEKEKGLRYKGNVMESLFEANTRGKRMTSFYQYSLILEAILTAPDAQFVKIQNGKPIYRKDETKDNNAELIAGIHTGIKRYFSNVVENYYDYFKDYTVNKKLFENIYAWLGKHKEILSRQMQEGFLVEDNYGSNTEHAAFEFYDRFVITSQKIYTIIDSLTTERVYIWCAGTHTEILTNLLLEKGFDFSRIQNIVDSNVEKEGTYINNIQVISKDTFYKRNDESDIIISSAAYEGEIYKELSQKLDNNIVRIYNID